eukprot:SAG31_NODE_1415_length_8443_cov_6.910986_5_plen_89_part_00
MPGLRGAGCVGRGRLAECGRGVGGTDPVVCAGGGCGRGGCGLWLNRLGFRLMGGRLSPPLAAAASASASASAEAQAARHAGAPELYEY